MNMVNVHPKIVTNPFAECGRRDRTLKEGALIRATAGTDQLTTLAAVLGDEAEAGLASQTVDAQLFGIVTGFQQVGRHTTAHNS